MCIYFAKEYTERGIVSKEDTDGIDLRFGHADGMVEMIRKIAFCEGFGAVLADGVEQAAKKIGWGAEKYAMHIKGQELPLHDPRGKQGLVLSYAASPTGAASAVSPSSITSVLPCARVTTAGRAQAMASSNARGSPS